MKDIQLDFLNKKIIDNYIDNKERVLQQIKVAVRSWLGDFYLDSSFGVDYNNSWGNKLLMETYIKEQISIIPGVSFIKYFEINREKENELEIFKIKCIVIYNKEEILIEDILKS